jgi:hypothetical protein
LDDRRRAGSRFRAQLDGQGRVSLCQFGNFNCGLNCGGGLVTDNVSFHANLLRGGVNYKF